MNYADVADLRAYSGIDTEDDDAYLNTLLGAAAEIINGKTNRVFKVEMPTNRTYRRIRGQTSPWDSSVLFLGAELAEAAVSITGSPTVIYLPEDRPPYDAIMLDPADTVGWSDPTVVNGYWGYSKTPPATIVEISLRIAKWLRDLANTKPVDFVTVTAFGQVIVPSKLPADILIALGPWIKPAIGG